jgi:hypothetical protein
MACWSERFLGRSMRQATREVEAELGRRLGDDLPPSNPESRDSGSLRARNDGLEHWLFGHLGYI